MWTRRDLLRAGALMGASLALGRPARAQAARPVLWVCVQAEGGWDQALFCDPQPALRAPYLDRDLYLYGVPTREGRGTGIVRAPSAAEVRTTPGGGLHYLGFADFHHDGPDHPYSPFFPSLYDRITVFNGLDTATNNHVVGARYCASGRVNEGGPCLAAQLAAALGPTRPLAFLSQGGYAETAGLVAATPLRDSLLPNLLAAVNPLDVDGDNGGDDAFLGPSLLNRLDAARAARRARLAARATLPGHRRALAAVEVAEAGAPSLRSLHFRANDLTTENLVRVGLAAARRGLTATLNLTTGGFDSHEDNEQQQVQALYNTLELLKFLVAASEAPDNGEAPVPLGVVVTSDFGRTPYRTGGGTDHWPTASMLVLLNRPAQALGLALPGDTVIGGTTDGDAEGALRPRKVHPRTLAFDDRGVVLTPGHVVRVIHRLAGVAEHPALAAWPIEVEGDLALG